MRRAAVKSAAVWLAGAVALVQVPAADAGRALPGNPRFDAVHHAAVQTEAAQPEIAGAAGILIDLSDGKVLWEKNAAQRRQIASLTKVLTALVAIETGKPSQMITASPRAEAIGNDDPLVTELELTAGEQLTVQQLVYGMLLPSANDAAVALAEGLAGSVGKFAGLMNATARRLGARDSNFVNPHGFDDPRQYSTARDLAVITAAAMRNAEFRKIVGTRVYSIVRGGNPPQEIRNRNLLLGSFDGADGVKTGQTRAAGKALIASARRGSEQRASVVLGSPDPVADSSRLLSWGFDAFRRFQAARSGRAWGVVTYGNGATAEVVARRDVSMLVKASGRNPSVRFRPDEKVLIVAGGARIPVSLKCRLPACHRSSRTGTAIAWVIGTLASLMGFAR